jgi:plasmid replication initiation protein
VDITSTTAVNPLVVQHNALVNAKFDLNTHEARLFLALLARLQRTDTAFGKCQLLVREIVPSTGSNNVYDQVRRMLKDFASRTLTIEKLSADGRPLKKPSFTVIPLLAYATYLEGEGMIEAQFNDLLLPYLLELRDNFTKAQLTELLKLKSANSYRIYWLLREYAAFGKRTIRLEELKAILGLDQEYDRFNNFRARILDRAQAELAATDLPFTYEAIKQGREVAEIKFSFKPVATNQAIVAPSSNYSEWETAVVAAGVSAASLPIIQTRLTAGDYDLGYVRYVLDTVKGQVQTGKIKKEGGAVFKALTDGYLLPDYQQKSTAAVRRKKSVPSANLHRKKLLTELEDARNSLRFIQTAVIYNDDTRAVAAAEVQAKIDQLEKQLVD